MALESTGGRQTFYGQLPASNKFGAVVSGNGGKKQEIRLEFDYDDLPAASAANKMLAEIPSGAVITDAHVKVLTAIAGTTPTLTIGTTQADGGGAIDANGIDDAIAEAALATGLIVTCDGAQIDGIAMSEAAVIVATTGGTVTAGRFELTVQYLV